MYASGDGYIDISLIHEDKYCIFLNCDPKFIYTCIKLCMCSYVTYASVCKQVWHENKRETKEGRRVVCREGFRSGEEEQI